MRATGGPYTAAGRAPCAGPDRPMHDFSPPPRARATTWVAVALLLALAIPFRAFLDSSVAPEHVFSRNDEGHYVPRVMGFMRGEWSDFNFINPTFSLHLFHAAAVLFGWVLVLIGRFDSYAGFSAEATVNPYFVTIAARSLAIGASVAAVAVAYLCARRLFSAPVALVAAAALAVDKTHVMRTPLAGSESLMMLFVLLFFLAALRYLEAPSARRHAIAGIALGLAAATKYNAGIQVVTLAVASLTALFRTRAAGARRGALRERRFWVGFLAAPLAFTAASPFAIVHLTEFLGEFRGQVDDFLGAGMAGIQEPQIGWTFYVTDFRARTPACRSRSCAGSGSWRRSTAPRAGGTSAPCCCSPALCRAIWRWARASTTRCASCCPPSPSCSRSARGPWVES